jgi:uncharacterized protein (DUF58 family)
MLYINVANKLRERFRAWIDSRQPAASQHRLNHHCLYIFPSVAGLSFLVLAGILWLAGTNYENNLVLALAFLLIALFVVTIFHTYANLSGLSVQLLGTGAAISGEPAEIRILLSRRGNRSRDNIHLHWAGSEPVVVNLLEQTEAAVSIFVPSTGRGWFDPRRLSIHTHFPLGFLRCWTRLDMNCRVLVYPKPIPAGPLPQAHAIRDQGDVSLLRGADEFSGYRDYQPGDSLRNVAWKQYARGAGLYSKHYSAFVDSRLWLDWDYLAGMSREARLSRLCYWVLQADRTDTEYGVRLPGEVLPPGRGPGHREQALRMLALFENEG